MICRSISCILINIVVINFAGLLQQLLQGIKMKNIKKATVITVDDRTIINNNNNYNNDNNDSYNLCSSEQQNLTDVCDIGVASLRETSQEKLPANLTIIDQTIPQNWDYIKLDLFNNASDADLIKNKNKFKLAISIKRTDKEGWVNFRALLNSPFRNLKRGLDSETYDNEHYTNVRESYAELKEHYPNTTVSKTYMKGQFVKGQTAEDLSVVLSPTDQEGEYLINLHFREQQWLWRLSTSISPAQRKNNIIASLGIRKGNKVKNVRAGDLLG